MKRIILFALTLLTTIAYASTPQYTKADSTTVVKLLNKGRQQKKGTNLVIFYARQLRGIPYVAQTLETNNNERLIINLRQLDCTTYLENVMAFTLCTKYGKKDFNSFCYYLRMIRYQNGTLSYARRNHYFSVWIASNTKLGFVEEKQAPNPPFTTVQQLDINYMSTHVSKYPMLIKHKEWIKDIAEMENNLNGKTFRYIPKNGIKNTNLLRNTIHDGDIIAITTNKLGLDTSHIGIAIWHKDGLHMLNASMVRHRVVEEPMTLSKYMSKHPSQSGIRIIAVK